MQNAKCRMQKGARARVLLACCILHFALLVGCGRREQPPDPDIITVAARVGPNSLHPLKANDEGTARVSQLVFESLMDIGDDLNVIPALAERFETPDAVTFIVHLRRGVKFHDGRDFTSKDVVFTFQRDRKSVV